MRPLTAAAFSALVAAACGGSGSSSDTDAPSPLADAGTADRAGPVVPAEHPRIYLGEPGAANRVRLQAALAADAPAAARFRQLVDDQLAGIDHYEFQAWFAALMGQLTGDARYCDYAIAAVETRVADEEARIAAGERAEIAADSYLYVGEHVANVTLVLDWCYDAVAPTQRDRWIAYANQAVWNVWHPDEATWGGAPWPWSGWSIDNPSNNYYYSFLRATMLLGLAANGEHPDAEGWLAMFRQTKIQEQLAPTFLADLAGGGSREGSGYGVAMGRLFELYDWWEASTGERIHDLTPHARESLAHFLHLTVPTLDRIAPVGDHARDSTAALFDYHRHYVQILVFLYRDDPLAPIGKWWLEHCSVPRMDQSFMFVHDFLYDEPAVVAAPSMDALHPAYVAPGTGQIYARSSWSADATWLHTIAGPYTESHAHRDQGSFLIYADEWLAYDANIDSHSGIRQEEELHNLVRIENAGATVPMREGSSSTLVAFVDEPDYAYIAIDVTPMYADPAVQRVERELVFLKPDVVVVFDRVDVSPGALPVWQLNSPVPPSINGGIVTIPGASRTLTIHRHGGAAVTIDPIDWAAIDPDMNGGHRVDVAHTATGDARFFHVLYLDGAVESLSLADAGTRQGLTLGFTPGGTATVRFETNSVGGDLEITDASGAVVISTPLVPGVTLPPLFD